MKQQKLFLVKWWRGESMDLVEAYWTLEHLKCDIESQESRIALDRYDTANIDNYCKVQALEISLRIMKPVVFREET